MGIKDGLKRLGGGSKAKVRDRCERNPDTGEVTCKRTRVHQDGTEVDIAGFTMTADASCNATATSSYENEEGQLEALEKKFVPKVIGKCKNTPPDY